jgi:ribosomal protein S18 acetylase RimI-like enzyme
MTTAVANLEDTAALERYFRRDIFLNLYQIGDLDDHYRPYATWYGLKAGAGLQAVALLYQGLTLPALLALGPPDDHHLATLLRSIAPKLPSSCYAHLSPGMVDVIEEYFNVDPHGEYLKMGLVESVAIGRIDTSPVLALDMSDEHDLQELYEAAYPGHWFESRMLQLGKYFGIRRQQRLVSAAGTHIHSPSYRVATIGNIVTHPEHRGLGLATAVTARLCLELKADVDHIGLNVKTDNYAAISCYQRLGFRAVARYFEQMLTRRGESGS